MAKNGKATYFTVGSASSVREGEVFRDVRLPGGETVRVMNRRVFESALASADRVLSRTRTMEKNAKKPA